jgi:type IV pilus assembly protein PilA
MSSIQVQDAKQEDGFTLIELLVVVIIIGILAAIAIPTFLSQRERGWQAAIVSDTRNAALEVEADYTSRAGATYPANQAAFDVLVPPDTVTYPVTASLTYTTDGTTWFCITGVDTRVDNGQLFVYDSAEGGMQEPGTACSNP